MGECLIIRSGSGIDTTAATATSETVVTGYTCYVNDELVSGAIPTHHIQKTLKVSDSINVPYGCYDTKSNIAVGSLISETVGNVTSGDVVMGSTGWVNGQMVTGSIPIIESTVIQLNPNDAYRIPPGWYNKPVAVSQTIPIQEGVSVSPTTEDTVVCASGVWTTGSVVIVGDTNLIPENIKNGAEIYGVRGNFVGWVDSTLAMTNFVSVSFHRDQWNSTKWWASSVLPQNTYNTIKTQFNYLVCNMWYVATSTNYNDYTSIKFFVFTNLGNITVTTGNNQGVNSTWQQYSTGKLALSQYSWVKSFEIDCNPSKANTAHGWVNSYDVTFTK